MIQRIVKTASPSNNPWLDCCTGPARRPTRHESPDMDDTPASRPVVHLTVRDHIAFIAVDNPPVNALSTAVRRGLMEAIAQADADANVHAVLLHGLGKAFIAGADIREFGLPPQAPSLPEVCLRIEACDKPVVAALHGPALGGGLEVALSAHWRVATPSAKLVLPEVQLGLLPGAGGTQRAPRLIGAEAALDLMLSGRHVGAQEALRLGLIDRVATQEDALAEGEAFVRHVLAEQMPVRRTGELREALADRAVTQAAIDAARAEALGIGVYKLANPGTVNHICIGVENYDPEKIAARLKEMGITATIDRNPANRTSGGDQLYFNGPDNCRVQLGAHGYQG